MNSCPAGYYYNSTLGGCANCHPYCKTCTDGTTASCSSCASNVLQVAPNTCAVNCLDGYYLNGTTKSCQACRPECFRCNNGTACTQCQENFYLLGSACLTKCPPGYFPVDALQYQVANISSTPEMFIVYYPYCKKCDTECKTCTGEGNGNCVDCSDNYFKNPAVINGVVGYQCLNTCPPGKFANNGACTACGSTCSTCNALTSCLTCNTGYLLNGICRTDCPDGYFPNKANLICQ